MKTIHLVTTVLVLAVLNTVSAGDDGVAVDPAPYANRPLLPDFTARSNPDNPHGLRQIKGNLYRHTTGAGLAVQSPERLRR
jgi:hypothetical protein